jgi:hypothetical protein
MENISNIPQAIIEQANRLCAIKGNTKSFEQRVSELMEMEAKKAKKQASSKNEAKWNQRELVSKTPVSNRTMAEINRENALNNLPSSMR